MYILYFFFFFFVSGDHRDLPLMTHSFPTRRSSDLLDAVNLLVVERRGEIDPVVGDDARVHRPHTGEDGGMTDAGDGRGMALIARGKDRAVEQARETAGEAVPIFGEQIGRELIDRDDEEKFRRGCYRRGGGGCRWRAILRAAGRSSGAKNERSQRDERFIPWDHLG